MTFQARIGLVSLLRMDSPKGGIAELVLTDIPVTLKIRAVFINSDGQPRSRRVCVDI